MTDTTKVVASLNELIEICVDGEKGFRTAADGVQEAELRALCLQCANQRAKFANELKDEIRQYNTQPKDDGSVSGAIQRGWMNIKAMVLNNDENQIIASCEEEEDRAKAAYEKVLASYLPPNVTGLVQRQYTEIKAVHDRFSAMQKMSHP